MILLTMASICSLDVLARSLNKTPMLCKKYPAPANATPIPAAATPSPSKAADNTNNPGATAPAAPPATITIARAPPSIISDVAT